MDTRKINLNLSDRRHSQQGKISIVIGIVAIASLSISVYTAVQHQGRAGEEVGFIGLVGLFLSMIGFIFAYNGKISDKVYDFYPKIGLMINSIVLIALLVVFFSGFVF